MHCRFSNRLEFLYEKLVEELFLGPSGRPFARRLLIVGSPAMRSWVQLRMARDSRIGIAAGLEIAYLDPALDRLTRQDAARPILSSQSLTFAIELVIRDLYKEDPDLSAYLLKGNPTQKVFTNRITSLSSQLAELFQQYGLYGKDWVLDWEKKCSTWQSCIWNQIFGKTGFAEFPLKKITSALEHSAQKSSAHLPTSIHLFGISFIPAAYYQFLVTLSEQCLVYHYILSPCRAFWSDILSKSQQTFLLKSIWKENTASSQKLALEELLLDTNPLLANFGRLGREMATLVEEADPHSRHYYLVAEDATKIPSYDLLIDETILLEEGQLTLLRALQADMLLLKTPSIQDTVEFESYDHSIQVHAAPNKWREVQILYNQLIEAIRRAQQKGESLHPGDILVMAPDISGYIPYIRAVFESEESQLPIQVMDLKLPMQNEFIQGFFTLLNLSQNRWQSTSVMQLLDCKPFTQKHGFKQDEINLIKRWTQEASISWGFDQNHRDELLKRNHCTHEIIDKSGFGSWKDGIGRLIEMAVCYDDESKMPIETTAWITLGRWSATIHALYHDLLFFEDQAEKTGQEWIAALHSFIPKYLDTEQYASNIDSFAILNRTLQSVLMIANKFPSQTIPFTTIYQQLFAILNNIEASYREGSVQSVHFCSMQPMRAIPAKFIAMLGMNEGMIPRPTPFTSHLDLLKGKGDYVAQRNDFDRFMFLETLLSARETLYFSYVNNHDALSSPLLYELMDYLKSYYRIRQQPALDFCFIQHPFLCYDTLYFKKDSPTHSYLTSHYNWACAAANPIKKPPRHFFDSFAMQNNGSGVLITDFSISLDDLRSVASNPLRAFFKLGLNTQPNKLGRVLHDWTEPLSLSALEAGSLRKMALDKPLKDIVTRAVSNGNMPLEPLRTLFANTLLEEITLIKDQLQEAGIEEGDLYKIVLSEYFSIAERQQNGDWHLPPFEISLSNGERILIEGEIPYVSDKGLIAYVKESWDELIKVWPNYLLYLLIIREYSLELPAALWTVSHKHSKGIKEYTPFFDHPEEHLQRFIEYYFLCKNHPSPLLPKFVPLFLKRDVEGLQKELAIDDSNPHQFPDEFLLWGCENYSSEEALSQLVNDWYGVASSLFGAMEAAWKK